MNYKRCKCLVFTTLNCTKLCRIILNFQGGLGGFFFHQNEKFQKQSSFTCPGPPQNGGRSLKFKDLHIITYGFLDQFSYRC